MIELFLIIIGFIIIRRFLFNHLEKEHRENLEN